MYLSSITRLTSTTVECIDVLQIFGRESVSLSQLPETDAGVQWNDGWLAISGEGICTVVHEGEIVITDSIRRGYSRTCFLELILQT